MATTLRTSGITMGSSTLDVTGSAPSFTARAWVNFNGQGTVAIRASGNVSSITDLGVGDYRVNFSTAMADANYVPLASSQETSSTTKFVTWAPRMSGLAVGSVLVSGVRENSTQGNLVDVLQCRVAVFH